MRGPALPSVPFVFACLAAAACSAEKPAEVQPKAAEPTRALAGVYPEKFRCDSIATTDTLAALLGGAARQIESPSSTPRGVPAPCSYEIATQIPEYWTFDFDCRDGMKERADALFAQYTRTSAELLESYNQASDAGPKPGVKPDAAVPRDPDAGPAPVARAPEAAAEVQVGAKALDHHGQGLLFIDDDAPCYVRVVGPDAPRRLALGQHIAKQLTFANAPMTPRAAK